MLSATRYGIGAASLPHVPDANAWHGRSMLESCLVRVLRHANRHLAVCGVSGPHGATTETNTTLHACAPALEPIEAEIDFLAGLGSHLPGRDKDSGG